MFDKVLILSASAGAGHVRAAQALVHAFTDLRAARQIIHVDTLEYTSKAFGKIYANAHIQMASKTPEVLSWMYDRLDKPWKNEGGRLAVNKLFSKKLIKMLKNHQPDIAVCTHFLPSEIISWLRDKGKISYRQAIVVTDLDVHALWLCRNYERYFVPIDEARVHLRELGIPADKITVSGIPIDPVFTVPKSKSEMRRKHGLHPDRTGILISAGGVGVKSTKRLMESLMKMEHPAQLIVLCGRNQKLLQKITAMASRTDNENIAIEVVGYTPDVDEYMTAADIFLGKPGGMTVSEAMAKGLVMVIVNPIPGQEERNSDHLLEEGVAIRCNQLETLAFKIDGLIADQKRFKLMQRNIRAFARPAAAADIVRQLLKDARNWRDADDPAGYNETIPLQPELQRDRISTDDAS